MKEKDVNPLKNMIVPLCQVKLLFFFKFIKQNLWPLIMSVLIVSLGTYFYEFLLWP